jgi:hypothetical protein
MTSNNKYSLDMWDWFYSWERKIHIKPKQGFFQSYDIFLCDEILKQYLPINEWNNKLKICEIWSWDWKLLKKISNMFNYEPTWLEYSPEWVQQWLDNWVNTVLCDAFNDNQLKPYFEYFDIVYSYWFIEHIIPVENAIKQHLKILKKWWILILQIPRLKWLNYLKFKFFRPDLIPLHNIDLMEDYILSKHCKWFEELEEILCKNYWTLKIRLPIDKKWFKYYLLKIIGSLEYITNPFMRFLFWKKWFETSILSPSVIYIWKKIK